MFEEKKVDYGSLVFEIFFDLPQLEYFMGSGSSAGKVQKPESARGTYRQSAKSQHQVEVPIGKVQKVSIRQRYL